MKKKKKKITLFLEKFKKKLFNTQEKYKII
jgi:hypothetical protein